MPSESPQHVELGKGGAVIVDELGAVPILTQPSNEEALLIELGGRLNKMQERRKQKYLLSPGQAAELIANIIVACGATTIGFRQELDRALTREQDRVKLIEEMQQRG